MTKPPSPVLVWFRDDLRTADNPALCAAAERGVPIITVFVLDEATPGLRRLGGASRWWLHHSLAGLRAGLAKHGVPLLLRRGPAADVLVALARETGAASVHWNRRYSPGEIAADTATKAALTQAGVAVTSHAGNLLFEPWTIRTGAGGPFRVFTPFWKACLAAGWQPPLRENPELRGGETSVTSDALGDWGLLPRSPDWAAGFPAHWTPGEQGARARLEEFITDGLSGYASLRDRPDRPHTSRLSAHLRFGEVSARTVAAAICQARDTGAANERDADKFLSELGWREFSHHLLYHFPTLPHDNLQPKFVAFAWREDPKGLEAWQKGLTGYPIVDAGMRELWRTGTMHNRVRMVVASFLIKDLLVDWRQGEVWFWDTLVDADHANNAASWQWVAGSGADAAPFFRIFNPVLQGEKHDPDGAYVRTHVPELARLPAKYIHRPWEAPSSTLFEAGIELGATYPHRIVDHAMARDRALEAFKATRG